jgi:hypothetical protein
MGLGPIRTVFVAAMAISMLVAAPNDARAANGAYAKPARERTGHL